jgi:hypothetical protein
MPSPVRASCCNQFPAFPERFPEDLIFSPYQQPVAEAQKLITTAS